MSSVSDGTYLNLNYSNGVNTSSNLSVGQSTGGKFTIGSNAAINTINFGSTVLNANANAGSSNAGPIVLNCNPTGTRSSTTGSPLVLTNNASNSGTLNNSAVLADTSSVLYVDGNSSVTGNLTVASAKQFTAGGNNYPIGNGSNNQVLTTNGSGTLNWNSPFQSSDYQAGNVSFNTTLVNALQSYRITDTSSLLTGPARYWIQGQAMFSTSTSCHCYLAIVLQNQSTLAYTTVFESVTPAVSGELNTVSVSGSWLVASGTSYFCYLYAYSSAAGQIVLGIFPGTDYFPNGASTTGGSGFITSIHAWKIG